MSKHYNSTFNPKKILTLKDRIKSKLPSCCYGETDGPSCHRLLESGGRLVERAGHRAAHARLQLIVVLVGQRNQAVERTESYIKKTKSENLIELEDQTVSKSNNPFIPTFFMIIIQFYKKSVNQNTLIQLSKPGWYLFELLCCSYFLKFIFFHRLTRFI
jgi:hypothetical protein